jgi:hypothetical protein
VCLEQGGYQHLYLPNEYEADHGCVTHTKDGVELWRDPRTKEGELLWPAKVGDAEVMMLKRKLGSYGYSGQYQQRPSPAGGGVFQKHWWPSRPPPVQEQDPISLKEGEAVDSV